MECWSENSSLRGFAWGIVNQWLFTKYLIIGIYIIYICVYVYDICIYTYIYIYIHVLQSPERRWGLIQSCRFTNFCFSCIFLTNLEHIGQWREVPKGADSYYSGSCNFRVIQPFYGTNNSRFKPFLLNVRPSIMPIKGTVWKQIKYILRSTCLDILVNAVWQLSQKPQTMHGCSAQGIALKYSVCINSLSVIILHLGFQR